jgi:hypothetical protein
MLTMSRLSNSRVDTVMGILSMIRPATAPKAAITISAGKLGYQGLTNLPLGRIGAAAGPVAMGDQGPRMTPDEFQRALPLLHEQTIMVAEKERAGIRKPPPPGGATR